VTCVLAVAWQFKLLGASARIVFPWVLGGLAGVVIVALLWARLLVQRQRAISALAPDRLLVRMAPRAGNHRDLSAGISALLGLSLLTVAAAQPQCGTKSVLAKRYGMDVVIALDASTSMLARDVKPSRIERAKLELTGLIDRLKGDRIGLVIFAGDAFVQCPLTTDYSAAKLFLRAVSPNDLPQQGTALAGALRTAGTLFDGADAGGKSTAAGKAIVVITDGEDHEGEADMEAKKLGDSGVRIFTVGVGSKTGEPIPIPRGDGTIAYKQDHQGRTVMTRLNEEVLKSLAEASNGRYVYSASGDLGIGEITEELARMDKAEFDSRETVDDDRVEYLAWPGVLLLGFGWALGEGRFRRRRESVT
jgi:Ca-activated chloride channel family protein